MDDEQREANQARQAELYGAPLGDAVRTVTSGLGLSQAAVARVLGVSSPMLSQLVSGQRIKLANPQAVQRLQSLLTLTDEAAHGLAHDRIAPRLAEIEADTRTGLTRTTSGSAPLDLPASFGRLLRAVASGRELAEAADALQADHPALAELLRAYGTGHPGEAERHYAAIAHLL